MNIFHVIVKHGVAGVEADNPEDAHKKCGYKFTGKFDSLGRFEIVRQPEGVYGSTSTWMIWDHRSKDKSSDAFSTLKSAKEDLERHASRGAFRSSTRSSSDLCESRTKATNGVNLGSKPHT